MKSLYDISEVIDLLFATYHPHYKEKFEIIKFTYNSFFFQPLQKLLFLPSILSDHVIKFAIYHPHYKDKLVSNLARIFACATWLGLIVEKKELLKTSLYLFSHPLQLLSPFFNLIFSKIYLAIFKYMIIFK